MTILPSTVCLPLAQEPAAEALRAGDLLPAELGERPGRVQRATGHPVACMAFLPAERGLTNLAALDEDFRRTAVHDYREALSMAADLGISVYAAAAGWNLAGQPGLPNGRVVPATNTRQKAQSQLLRSFDALADHSDALGITLAVRNMAPDAEGMLSAPTEIRKFLEILQAPAIRLYLDLAALEKAAIAKRADPEEAASGLADLAVYCRVQTGASWMQSFLSRQQTLPIVLERPVADAPALREALLRLREELQGVTPR